ncbi:MMPL family transporter [Alkalihalobacillus oceani]|uniref:MMPL family transporter n=1 Tax=Halalkalibacter oceani TaxID=1653776 RepID=A0A9X2DTN9_9BACI|nr:MMPL family transporter [Halalkalibacter oceani]MCM3716476.1 MMPL family transporter [Halalkalibacter oceani]
MIIKLAARITTHKKMIVITFILLAVISIAAQFFVSVNYNMADYLPDEAQSTRAVDVMEDEFTSSVPDTRVMVEDVSIQEALQFKERLAAIDGVSDVMWLDDAVDIKMPIEVADASTVETYYKDEIALFQLSIRPGEEVRITDEIYQLIGEEGAMAGEAVNTATAQKMAGTETVYAAALLVPIIILILVLSTTSWVEPLFFLVAIGVSVLINLGTNIFIGEVSFVTQSVAPILQLAVSLDYAIFLLHSFQEYRKKTTNPEEAMQLAMKQAFAPIAASAATTFFGFMALMLMSFELGADLGLSLVKGILLSFISVMVFFPALTLVFYKWMDKTQHKRFVPSFAGIGRRVMKMKYPSLLLVLAILIPSFLAQSNTAFTYGLGEQPESTRTGADLIAIKEAFGESTPIVLLVPKDDVVKEEKLIHELEDIGHVTNVISYVNTVGSAIPPEYLEEEVTSEFLSAHYSRLIINTEREKEGDIPFSIVETVQEKAASYYGDKTLSLGESVALYDIKNTVQKDNTFVNTMTVATIAIVLLLTFKSISLPVILLITIQAAVWINLSIPYFTNTSFDFIGYLIVSTVQLAATVDYAILFTETYKEKRREMPALKAIIDTLDEKTFSISVSASILSSIGFILWITSTNPVVSSIGLLLGRGALLAFVLVLFFLPAMLYALDKVIRKTTLQANFYKGK